VSGALRAAAAKLAYSGKDVLVLFPLGGGDTAVQTLDALPAFSAAVAQKDRWPGILFWSQHGASAFSSEAAAIDATAQFVRTSSEMTDECLDRAITQLAELPPRRILHLSDLHFGSEHASINVEYVEGKLSQVARGV